VCTVRVNCRTMGANLPWDWYPDFRCFPNDLAEDDLHLYGPISFEINRHRWLKVVRLRSSNGVGGLILQQGTSVDTAHTSNEDDLAHDLPNCIVREVNVRLCEELPHTSP